jgi:hypothetical protein
MQALVFCLIDQQTQFWHKAPGDSDFKIPLSFGSSSGGTADVAIPEELSQVGNSQFSSEILSSILLSCTSFACSYVC